MWGVASEPFERIDKRRVGQHTYLRPLIGTDRAARAKMGTARGEPNLATARVGPAMLSAFPRVGPTETIIEALEWERALSDRLRSRAGESRPGLIEGALGPDGPGDAGELVGQSRRGAVVAATLMEVQSPGVKPVGTSFSSGGEKNGSGAVDQECPEVGVAAFVDSAEVLSVAAGVLPGR